VIYLALGISGQANHVAGMDASGVIIAVNKRSRSSDLQRRPLWIVEDIWNLFRNSSRRSRQEKVLEHLWEPEAVCVNRQLQNGHACVAETPLRRAGMGNALQGFRRRSI